MTRVATGGPAFPGNETYIDGHPTGWQGMDLRDWFAGQALAGICAGLCSSNPRGDSAYDRVSFNDAAKDAYTIADAMLAEKAKATLANREADKKEFGDDLPF